MKVNTHRVTYSVGGGVLLLGLLLAQEKGYKGGRDTKVEGEVLSV